jgi:ribosomal protein L11 methyltransferase
MKWTEIRIKTTEEAYDAISEMLNTIGAGGVAIEDPNEIRREIQKPNSLDYADDDFLEALGEDVIIKAYFPGDRNIIELEGLIKEKISFIGSFLDTGEGYAGYSQVDDEDWATAWKKYYKPLHLTSRVVIKPTWEEYTTGPDEVVIELDPGMAFGTGTHETTQMCAQLLEKYMKTGDRIADVGCGTGILAIIAAKLGARHVTAVDIDDIAVRVTRENCTQNRVQEVVSALQGVLEDIPKEKVEIVVANIIANVIIDIAGSIPDYLKRGGFFITSGIIRARREEVMEAYTRQGFTCEETLEMGEWVAMVFTCRDSL